MSEETLTGSPVGSCQNPVPLTQVWFAEFDLPDQVLAGLKDLGYTCCTPLQAQVIPPGLAGRDLAVQIREDTGHRVAFLVPLFTRLLKLPERDPEFTPAILLAPTPEEARQVYDEALALGSHTGLSLVLLPAEPGETTESEAVQKNADIVVGTPGSVIASIKKGELRAAGVKVLVVDQGDRFFELNLVRDLRYLLRKLPHHEKRTTMLFSASLSLRVLDVIYHFMDRPEFVSDTLDEAQLQGVEQSLLHVASQEKASLLPGLLRRETWRHVLVFANSPETVDQVARSLKNHGLPAEGIYEDLPQRQRLRLMARIQKGQVKILVTTDGASRALHVVDVTHVINYDLPQGSHAYIDHLCRLSAPDKPGRVISLACEEFVFHLQPIEEMLGYKIPVVWPQDDWFVEDKQAPAPAVKEVPAEESPTELEAEESPTEVRAEPAPKAEEVHEEKKAIHGRGGTRIVFSTQPGGVFGLAPVRTAPTPEPGAGPKKKPRRRRPRKPPKAPPSKGAQTSEPAEKISTE